MEARHLFDAIARFETDVGELYEALAEHFADDADAAALFSSLALDERGHVSLASYQRDLTTRDSGEFRDVQVDIDELCRAIDLVQQARSEAPGLDLRAALGRALAIEATAAERHYRLAMRQANPGVAALLDSLGKADIVHRGQLESFAARRGVALAAEPEGRAGSA